MTAAHAVLFCQELALNILEELVPLTEEEAWSNARLRDLQIRVEYNARATDALASICRTCRTFSELATPVLWRRLSDLDPFIRLFSQTDRSQDEWGLDDRLVLTEPLPDAEWERFQHYAPYLRELDDRDCRHSWDYQNPTWVHLCAKANGRPLFPRLTRLWAVYLHSAMVLEVPLLISSIRSLAVVVDDWDNLNDPETIRKRLVEVHKTVPRLQHLGLRCDKATVLRPLPTGAIPALAAFTDVRSIIVDGNLAVDYATLAALSELPLLESLTVELAEDFESAPPSPTICFAALRKASLRGPPGQLAAFFSMFSFPRLQELSVDYSTHPQPADLLACTADLFGKVPRHLTYLAFNRLRPRDPPWIAPLRDMPHPQSLLEIIRPALQLRALEVVTINFVYLPSLDDADLAEMLAAWPALTELSIDRGRRCIDFVPDRPTARSLVEAAARCPKLRVLVLPETDLRNAGRSLSTLPDGDAEHGLKTLILHTELEKSRHFSNAALLLNELFPHLELPPEGQRGDGSSGNSLMAVEELFGIIRHYGIDASYFDE